MPSEKKLTNLFERNAVPSPEYEKRPRIVSRSFIFKSATPERIQSNIQEGTKLEDLSFVNNVMGLKGPEAKNPNQLMPLGGVIKKEPDRPMWEGEHLSDGTERELFEEGYIRGTEYHVLGRQKYKHNDNDVQQILSYTKMSPYDEVHQLHPEEDKFAEYAYLDLNQTKALFHDGSINLPSQEEAQLVDSLNIVGLGAGGGQGPLKGLKGEQIKNIQNKLTEALEQAEMEKKKSVLKTLVRFYDTELNITNSQTIIEQIDESNIYQETQKIYRKVIRQYGVQEEQLLESLSLSNLIEELKQLDTYGNDIEATLRVLAIMPEVNKLTQEQLTILQESKLLEPSLTDLITRLNRDKDQLDLFEEGGVSVQKIERLNPLNKRDAEWARTILHDKFGISAQDFYEIGQLYDTFIDEISQKTIADRLGHEFNISLIEQLNDVANCNPVELLQAASGVGPAAHKFRSENPIEYKRLLFEGRRKLYIMSLITKVMDHYAKEREKGNAPLEIVWNSLQSTPHMTDVRTAHTKDGEFFDVITPRTPENTINRYHDLEEQQTITISPPQQDSIRDLRLQDKTVTARVFERPIKSKGSTIRKAMMGVTYPTDVFARTIIIDSYDDILLAREQRNIFVREKDTEVQKKTNDHAVIFNIMDAFQEQVRTTLGNDWTCAFKKYTPTPEGEEYKYKGRRAGTGGRIRLSKFVIQLESPDGKQYSEEVQIFTPAHGKSGYYYFQEKANDDARYQVDRMLTRHGMRSLIEQMFPHSVFKPIPTVYRKDNKKV